jgi:glucokinase
MPLLASGVKKPIVIGADVGGTKIAAALVDSQGQLMGYQTRRTDVSSSEATLDYIAEIINQVISKGGVPRKEIRGVGLGIPGLVDPERGIGLASVNLQWKNVGVTKELEKRVGIPCVIENDVKAAALGEVRFGVGQGVSNLVYVNIGTGVAAAIVIDRKIFRGQNGMAGEIGHAVIDINGPDCKCGGHGCLEAIVSGPAIVARAKSKIELDRSSHLSKLLNEKIELTSQDIYNAAHNGDIVALETVHEVSRFLAIAIQFLSLAYDPQMIVLGGGVVHSSDDFLKYLLGSINQLADASWVFRQLLTPDFVQVTKLGSNIGILGAAALVP